MPPAIIAAAVAGAAGIGSAVISGNAAKKASNAAKSAADQNAQVQREIYNQTRADLAPYAAAGGGALAALSQRLGLTPLTANGAPMPGAQQTNPGAYSSLPGSWPQTTPAGAQVGGSRTSVVPAMGFGGGGGDRPVVGASSPTYRTTFRDGTPTPPGTYIGPSDELLPIPGASQSAGGAPPAPAYGGNAGQTNMSDPSYFAPGAPQTLPASSGAPTSAPAPAPTTGGGPDWQAYLAANPDVAAEYQRASAAGDPNSPAYTQKGLQSPETFAQWHYQTYGQGEGRNLPSAGAPQTPGGGAPDPNAPPPQYYSEQYAARPDAVAIPDFQRPDTPQRDPAMQFQDYGSGPQFSWDPSQIANDAGFKFETAETTKGVNAGAAARGKLRSGDAAKALQDRLFGVAHTYGNDYFNRALQGYGANRSAFESNRGYGTDLTKYQQNRTDNIFSEDRAFNDDAFINDRSYGTNLWNTVQNRNDNVFSEDRNFTANRNDQATSNLFALTGVGANAAAGAGQAGQNYANGITNSNNARATATGNAALINGQNISNLFGSAANAIGSYYGARRV